MVDLTNRIKSCDYVLLNGIFSALSKYIPTSRHTAGVGTNIVLLLYISQE